VTEDEIRDAFASCGPVKKFTLVDIRVEGPICYGIVEFETRESADLAVQASRRVAVRKRLISTYYSSRVTKRMMMNLAEKARE
jgi:RNA recognition motif-containing protein